jgi:hypothetical protein
MPDKFGNYCGCKGLIVQREMLESRQKRGYPSCNNYCNGTHRDLGVIKPIRDWKSALNQFSIVFEGKMPGS